MYYIEFEWDEGNILKLELRATIEEIESTFYDPKRKIRRSYFNRYQMLARTSRGRYLFVVYEKVTSSIIRVISVRDMIQMEKRRYIQK